MLTNYRKLKEENKKLQKEITELKISLACEKKANESLERDVDSLLHLEPNNNFISKDKIRDKIRDKILELTGIKGELEEKDFGIGFTLDDYYKEITIKIKSYKELLEE